MFVVLLWQRARARHFVLCLTYFFGVSFARLLTRARHFFIDDALSFTHRGKRAQNALPKFELIRFSRWTFFFFWETVLFVNTFVEKGGGRNWFLARNFVARFCFPFWLLFDACELCRIRSADVRGVSPAWWLRNGLRIFGA